jgi:hypothetical protein
MACTNLAFYSPWGLLRRDNESHRYCNVQGILLGILMLARTVCTILLKGIRPSFPRRKASGSLRNLVGTPLDSHRLFLMEHMNLA